MPVKLNTTYISSALADKLSHISEYPVTSIVAPIGYGKTRAIRWWADHCRKKKSDALILQQIIVTDSLTDFWRGFCRNLREWPELEKEMSDLGFPADPQARQLMMELLTDALAGKSHDVFYIIDDLHFLPDPAFTSLILFLSDHLPERTHIILLSRNVIFDRAAQMKLGPRLWELNVDDLRLGETDVREYARRSGQLLNIRDVNMLASSTEGWFSMVYLKLRAYTQTGKWPENTTNIYPLIDEVLFRPLTARQREFLVRLGVPDDFTMEEAEFLWPEDDTAALLSQLTEQNAFITCTDGVYRYHNMLRSCARKKFLLLPETEQNATLIRLGQWYEKMGECCLAAECYEKTGSWDDLLRTVGQDRGLSFGPERLPLMRRWMANCPEECQLRHPQALLVFMLLLFYGRDIPEMQRYHALFQRSMALCTDLSRQEQDQLEGEALLRLSFLCFNDISAMSAYHRQIRALIPADRNPWTQGSPSVLMLYHSKSGGLDRENAEMRECMPIYSRVASGHGSGAATIMQAETELMRGNLTDADILCRQAEEQALEAGEYSIYTAAAFLSARLALYEQPLRGGFPSLDRAADTLRRAHQYRLLTTVELGRAWLSALLGQTEQLPAWLTAEGASMAQVFPLIEPVFQVIVGRVLLAQSQWAQAAARTPRLLRASADARFVLCGIYAHLQNAMALMHLGKEAAARQALCEAWSLAQPDGILLPFAESDPCLDRLLDELAEGEARERLHTLAARFRAGREAIRREGGLLAQYGLTERELEIAGLAAQRKSSREIAEILSISVKSVNNRLNAVYEKLGLGGEGRNKRQALAKLMKIS